MKASFLQFDPQYLDRETNWQRAEQLLVRADADLTVLPELFTSGYFFKSSGDAGRAAERIPEGPTTQQLEAWARDNETTIVAGLAEEDAEGHLYNSAVVVSPSGYVGTYRKLHLYYEEKVHFTEGQQDLPVFSVKDRRGESYRLGVMICFDWYFPEAARTLALRGADVIAHPSNLVRKDCPRAMPIRALENHVYTITANRYGTESNGREALTFIGQSVICDPMGNVLAQAGAEGEAVGTAEIEPATARERRITQHNDLFADRRSKFYEV